MAITKELVDGLLVTIQNLYMADDIPWMIGYSGGKDSRLNLERGIAHLCGTGFIKSFDDLVKLATKEK